MERYNRMKQKLYELELQQHQQNSLEQQYRQQQQQKFQRDTILHRPVSAMEHKLDEQSSKIAESFVTRLKNLRPVNKNNQTTSSDSSVIQTDQNVTNPLYSSQYPSKSHTKEQQEQQTM